MQHFRSNNFHELFLKWKQDESSNKFQHCFSLNFGYHDYELSIPQIAMTPESNTKINVDFHISCFFVMIGGKYLNMIGNVMDVVNYITNYIGGVRPFAVFLSNDNYKEKLTINLDYGFERYKSTPVMVKLFHMR